MPVSKPQTGDKAVQQSYRLRDYFHFIQMYRRNQSASAGGAGNTKLRCATEVSNFPPPPWSN